MGKHDFRLMSNIFRNCIRSSASITKRGQRSNFVLHYFVCCVVMTHYKFVFFHLFFFSFPFSLPSFFTINQLFLLSFVFYLLSFRLVAYKPQSQETVLMSSLSIWTYEWKCLHLHSIVAMLDTAVHSSILIGCLVVVVRYLNENWSKDRFIISLYKFPL